MSSTETSAARVGVLVASLALGAVGLYWIADGFVVDGSLRLGNPVPIRQVPQPRQVRAEVVRVQGEIGVAEADECLFVVERFDLPGQGFQCRAQISCGGVLLYGGPRRGYFPCVLPDEPRREVVGTDAATTRADGDAAMHLDTARGILRIRDDSFGTLGEFSVDAEVLDVR